MRFSSAAVTMAATTPIRYNPIRTAAWVPKNGPSRGWAGMNAAISSAYTGRRAEQVMKGATKIVAILSRSSSTVRGS